MPKWADVSVMNLLTSTKESGEFETFVLPDRFTVSAWSMVIMNISVLRILPATNEAERSCATKTSLLAKTTFIHWLGITTGCSSVG